MEGRTDDYASDPGPENKVLLDLNPDSNLPPFTDKGNPPPFWYSFDLTAKRLQGGGWTHQVTEREIAQSKDLAGVNMRLTSGSFRELHWHLADEWAIMLAGRARVSVMQPDGNMFIDDVERGDLWYFPAGYPHSIQGLEGPGCEFLLVFDQGDFSEDDTFLLSDLLAHIPPDVIQKNMGWTRQEWDQLPPEELYIFPAELPGPLEADKRFLGSRLETENQYTFHGALTLPTPHQTAGGSARVVDSTNFPVSKNIAGAVVVLKPGAIRELHWHPNASEWQYWIQGKGRMTIVMTGRKPARRTSTRETSGTFPIWPGTTSRTQEPRMSSFSRCSGHTSTRASRSMNGFRACPTGWRRLTSGFRCLPFAESHRASSLCFRSERVPPCPSLTDPATYRGARITFPPFPCFFLNLQRSPLPGKIKKSPFPADLHNRNQAW
jgi:oxalate decarboxylase